MFEKFKGWWGRLPAPQRTLIAVGVPVVGVAAIVNRRSSKPAEGAEPVTPEADSGAPSYGATGAIAGGVGAGADDLTSFANMFSDALTTLETRLQGQIDAGLGGTLLPPETGVPLPAPVKPGSTTTGAGGVSVPGTGQPSTGGVAPPSGTPWLRRGSTGARVKTLQRWLHQHGYTPGPRDGIYGPQTEAAVRRFQGAAGVKVDGIYGPQTAAAARAVRSTGSVSGQGGGRLIWLGARAAVEPAIRPPAAAGRIGALRDRQRIAALASARIAAGQ
jgi:hypothetical protein